jgi:hypothetical protein
MATHFTATCVLSANSPLNTCSNFFFRKGCSWDLQLGIATTTPRLLYLSVRLQRKEHSTCKRKKFSTKILAAPARSYIYEIAEKKHSTIFDGSSIKIIWKLIYSFNVYVTLPCHGCLHPQERQD